MTVKNGSQDSAQDKKIYVGVEASNTQEQLADDSATKALQDLMKMREEGLINEKHFKKVLKHDIQKRLESFFNKLTKEQVKQLYKSAKTDQEKAALQLLFKEYKEQNRLEKQKNAEIKRAIEEAKVEADVLRGEIENSASYKAENYLQRVKNNTVSDTELKNFDKIINGKTLAEGKLNKQEKSYKSAFRKAFVQSGLSAKDFVSLLHDQTTLPDWNTILPKRDSSTWTKKESDNFDKGLLAYREAKKSNSELSRWNQIIGNLEVGLINEGKELRAVYTESLNAPISKKERKAGLRNEEANRKSAYRENNAQQLESARAHWTQKYIEQGLSQGSARAAAEELINKDLDTKWEQHLNDLDQKGIQKSDLGKFRVLTDAIKSKSPEEQIKILMTDTNFDGIGNYLDGRGVKRGMQVENALSVALNRGVPMDTVVENVIDFMKVRMPKSDLSKVKTPAEFAQWMSSDVENARAVQTALMDSPAETGKIFEYGKEAVQKTLEMQKFSPEDIKLIKETIDAAPALQGLSESGKELVLSSTASYLLAEMKKGNLISTSANLSGVSAGMNLPLDQILKGLSFNLGTGVTKDGKPFAGVGLAWNKEAAKWNL